MTSIDSRSNPGQEAADEIDLRQLLGTLLDHKWWIAGITGAFFAASVAYALLATPIYRADAVVQVESKMPSLPGLANFTQSLGSFRRGHNRNRIDYLALRHWGRRG